MDNLHAEVLNMIKRHGSLDNGQLQSGLYAAGIHKGLSPREAADSTGEITRSMVRLGLIENRGGRWIVMGGQA